MGKPFQKDNFCYMQKLKLLSTLLEKFCIEEKIRIQKQTKKQNLKTQFTTFTDQLNSIKIRISTKSF